MRRLHANEFVYRVPRSLDDLTGPDAGVVELPRSLYWGPNRTVDLGSRSAVQKMYQAVVRIGTEPEQARWLNRGLLLANWSNLVLPARCVSVWEERFPELAAR